MFRVSDQKNQAPAGAPGHKVVTELKVSGNLMTLESGLFCIFNAPGSAPPDAGTGLPGVRVSLPTGPAFRPDAVTITGFRDDGWLGGWDGAALVRVTRGPAQILVTIYQAPNSQAEAPRLQILRLAEAGGLPALNAPVGNVPAAGQKPIAAPAAIPAPAVPPSRAAGPSAVPQNTPASAANTDPAATSGAEIVAHIQVSGDVMSRLGEWMGEPGSKRWIEGFAIAPKGQIGPNDVEYQAVLGRGWLSPWAEGGQFCGSRGMSLPILGVRMRLRGEAAERFDCIVSASFVDGTKVGPLDNGEPCQAESMAPLEAFQIKVVPRGTAGQAGAPAKPRTRARPAQDAAPAPKPVSAPAPKPGKAPPRGKK